MGEHIILEGTEVVTDHSIISHVVCEDEQNEWDIDYTRWMFFHFDA